MSAFISFTILGIFTGAAYAIAASGLVLTYTTTRVFNIAHGAFGMVLAFTYWDFSVRQGLPVWLSLGLVLLVVAPAAGWFVQRVVARDLGDAPVSVSLVVTVGLFVGLLGLAQQIWPPDSRTLLPFFMDTTFNVFGTAVSGHQALTIVLSIAVAVGLYLLLNKTRIGTAMRASVDNPELLRLFGGKPSTAAALSWAIGISLAALAGILLTPEVGMDYTTLTLLVINAYAAAMMGRLKSLPLTFAGAIGLGILQSWAVVYLPTEGNLAGIRGCVPALFLFVVILVAKPVQLRIGQVKGTLYAPVAGLRKSLGWGVGLVLVVLALATGMSDTNLLLAGTAATYAIVMLSLVLLNGYGGYLSLAQFTFAGVGALTYAKLDEPNLYGLVVSALVAGLVGVVVALPVLRLTGLYLALATMAFGLVMDALVFQADFAFGFNGSLEAKRLSILGVAINSTSMYVVVMVIFFVLLGIGLLTLRRGTFGRLLIAMRDSPAACTTLGLDMRWFRVGLFGLSATIAGVAGALFAGLRGTVGATDFQLLASLPLLLFAVVAGVTTVTGALIGGIGLMLLPVLQSDHPGIAGLLFGIIGFGAVALGRDPNGLANLLFRIGHKVAPMVAERLPALRRAEPQDDLGPVEVTSLDEEDLSRTQVFPPVDLTSEPAIRTDKEVAGHGAARG